MSSSPRFRCFLPLALLLPLVLGIGCGPTTDPFADFEDGPVVERLGVIHFPASAVGDYEPRVLVAQTKIPVSGVSIQSIMDDRIPEADVIFNSKASYSFQAKLPLGMSLAAGAQELRKEPTIEDALPRFVDERSAEISLHQTSTGDFVYRSPRLTYLVVEDSEGLRPFNQSWVVKVRGKGRNPDNPVDPYDFVQVLSVEKVSPHLITLEGTLSTVGTTRSCFLLHRDNGDVVALLGSEAALLSQRYTTGTRVRVVGEDLGNSTDACSGGLQLRVETYHIL